jgi:hypothetical protein
MKLVEALIKAGFDQEVFTISDDGELGSTLTLNLPFGSGVSIAVTDYWAYPGIPSYFVNYNGENGNFSNYQGTPFIEGALMNLGRAFEQANKDYLATKGD